MQNIKSILLLNRTPGIRMTGLRDFFDQGWSASEIEGQILKGENQTWREALQATQKIFDPEKEMEKAEALNIQIIPWGHPHYPALLAESADPPLVLYMKGNFLETDQVAVAIVGSRHPSLYGLEQAERFSQKLSAWGITIVSGFARGIDRAGHVGALKVSYGRTIAVLGSGLDVIYPKEHQGLYEEVAERGALVSEFAFGAPPLAENFPKRNRIIAGLSLGVLVVEAHYRSGSLITAHLAAEEGREVFALPGRVDQLGSRGTLRLLKEGANLAENPEDILDSLSPQLWPFVTSSSDSSRELGEEEMKLLELFQNQALAIEQIIQAAGGAIPETSSLLTHLELKGKIRRRWDGRYERMGRPSDEKI